MLSGTPYELSAEGEELMKNLLQVTHTKKLTPDLRETAELISSFQWIRDLAPGEPTFLEGLRRQRILQGIFAFNWLYRLEVSSSYKIPGGRKLAKTFQLDGIFLQKTLRLAERVPTHNGIVSYKSAEYTNAAFWLRDIWVELYFEYCLADVLRGLYPPKVERIEAWQASRTKRDGIAMLKDTKRLIQAYELPQEPYKFSLGLLIAYAIDTAQRVEAFRKDAFKPWCGSLYNLLHSMEGPDYDQAIADWEVDACVAKIKKQRNKRWIGGSEAAYKKWSAGELDI